MKNAQRQVNLRRLFEEAGCTGASLVEQPYKAKQPPNVICTLAGATDSVIIVGAHFDHSTEHGLGVVDNWSGASLLPTLFESLRAHPRQYTFVFAGFGGEEKGLAGSRFFVEQLSDSQVAKTKAMVNLECLGLGPTKVWASHADRTLLLKLVDATKALNLNLQGINVENVATDDSTWFAKRGIRTISIHSVTQETLPILHGTRDNLSAVKLENYYDSYRSVVAYLAYLDATLQ